MPYPPVISIVAALAANRVIGCGNRLPWRLPADLRHFKALTIGKPIVMGRRTWESLPGLLPQRTHIVVTRDRSYSAPGCRVAHSPEHALALAGEASEVMIVGGADIYGQMLPRAGRMYLTLVHTTIRGDALFPEWVPEEWRELSREEHPADRENPFPYGFLVLERIKAP